MTQFLMVPLPDHLSISDTRRIAVETEAVITKRTGALVDATVTDLGPLLTEERRVLRECLDLAINANVTFGDGTLKDAAVIVDLRARIDPDAARVETETLAEMTERLASGTTLAQQARERSEELTRAQEYAADAMAAEYGRSRVRRLADGAVVIVGMTDDVERRSVCINRDGTERWRG